ncbi:mitochondrial inner membrane protein [Gymnopilus junonius]|uniref:Succinate dehydrogenase [ubiquinone] cytochrome b small subunit n=1 Tax=Gymnopilus junonius TaxID=109634 RepID=A0A9P5NTA0_GYMJU|nr:mitochondrial inner membrane protein [Gymnopilus junonius]
MSTSLVLRSTLPRALARRAVAQSSSVIQARYESTGGEAKYIPGGPVLRGTVNDPTTFPAPSRIHGSYHWAFERLLAASLVPLTAAAFVTTGSNYPIIDGLLGVTLVMHSHIGLDSSLVDYLHPRKFPLLGPICTWTLRGATVATLVGVYQFNTNDIGLTELIAKVWTA